MNESIDKIIKKITAKQPYKNNQIQDKYMEEVPQNSRITNYQLQDKNIALRKQFKKLEGIFATKSKVKTKLQATHSEIEQLKQKLKSVLNASQCLEMSIIKFKVLNQSRQKKQNANDNNCCCSRYRKEKSIGKYIKKSQKVSPSKNNETIHPLNQKQNAISNRIYPRQINQSQLKQIQCDLNYLSDKRQHIKQKKQHIQKLKKLIQFQNKVIKDYSQKSHINKNIGKILKIKDIKDKSQIKTCASIGCITKTSRHNVLK